MKKLTKGKADTLKKAFKRILKDNSDDQDCNDVLYARFSALIDDAVNGKLEVAKEEVKIQKAQPKNLLPGVFIPNPGKKANNKPYVVRNKADSEHSDSI